MFEDNYSNGKPTFRGVRNLLRRLEGVENISGMVENPTEKDLRLMKIIGRSKGSELSVIYYAPRPTEEECAFLEGMRDYMKSLEVIVIMPGRHPDIQEIDRAKRLKDGGVPLMFYFSFSKDDDFVEDVVSGYTELMDDMGIGYRILRN